jgi:hypothetical protein
MIRSQMGEDRKVVVLGGAKAVYEDNGRTVFGSSIGMGISVVD